MAGGKGSNVEDHAVEGNGAKGAETAKERNDAKVSNGTGDGNPAIPGSDKESESGPCGLPKCEIL